MKLLLALAVSIFCAPSIASAAVFAGSVEDPRDAPIVVRTGQYAADVKTVTARYDDSLGQLQVVVDFWPGRGSTEVSLSASLGISSTTGCVDGQEDAGIYGYASGLQYSYTGLSFNPATTGYRGTQEGQLVFSDQTYSRVTATYDAAALVRLGLRCVNGIRVGDYEFYDEISRFCLGADTCFAPPPVQPEQDTTAPTVSWATPKTGDVVSGILTESKRNCLVNAQDASGIARTENYVDGKLNDTQVNAPWSCDIDTRQLSDGPHTFKVKAYDRNGNTKEASAFVTVRNAGAPPVISPPEPPRPPANPVVPVGGPAAPVTPITPPAATPPVAASTPGAVVIPVPIVSAAPTGAVLGTTANNSPTVVTLSSARARNAAVKALLAEVGRREFKARRGFTLTCKKLSKLRQKCTLAYRTKQYRYKGSVTVTVNSANKSTSSVRLTRTRLSKG